MKNIIQILLVVFGIRPALATNHIIDFGGSFGLNYAPDSIVVNVGDIITWQGDFSIYPLESTSVPAGAALFGNATGPTFSYVVQVAGSYAYHCTVHPFMTGKFIAFNGFSQCTAPAPTGEVGLTPRWQELECANNDGTAYSDTIFIENWDSIPFGSTKVIINSLFIGSISGLPAGLTYKFDNGKDSITYGSGETGCVRIYGNTTALAGRYQLGINIIITAGNGLLTLPFGGGTIEACVLYVQVGQTGPCSFEYYVNVKQPTSLCDTQAVPGTFITTGSIFPDTICMGATIQVPYTASGAFNFGNTFSAQFSDASGSFANPTYIGVISATSSSSIPSNIPQNMPYGDHYRIRVVSDNPVVTGSDNGSDLTVDFCNGSTWMGVYTILYYQCSTISCHGAGNSGHSFNVDAAPPLLYADMVNDIPVNPYAKDSVHNKLVAPFLPAKSFLMRKISYCRSGALQLKQPYEGDDMPGHGIRLADSEIEYIYSWILAGAPETGMVSPATIGSSVCTYAPEVSVSGVIRSEIGSSVRSALIQLSGSENQSIPTTLGGSYLFEVTQGGSYTLTPNKNDDLVSSNGITTIDLLMVRKHLLGTQLLATPYKIIAADVNKSGSVTSTDILFIRSMILQISTTFPNGKLWTFVPDDYVFANPQNPFPFQSNRSYSNLTSAITDADFIGMKLGDVNNSWDPNTPKQGATGNLQMLISDYTTMPENEIIVPVKVKDFNNITGYQFTISWNPKALTLLDVSNKSLNGYFGKDKISEGYLTTSWDDEMASAISLNDDEVVFELKFKAIGENGASSEIKINSELTVAEAYNENLDLLEITPTNGIVKVGNVSSIANLPSSIINLQVQPNPFTNSTQIIFEIPKGETASIAIYDIHGRAVKQITGYYPAGSHSIEWAGDDETGNPLRPGLYYVRMTAGSAAMSRNVLLLR